MTADSRTGLDTTEDSHLEEVVRDRFAEGLVRRLEKKYPGANPADVEDAVAVGVEKLVRKGPTTSPRGYVTVVAENYVLKQFRRAVLDPLQYEDDDGELHERSPAGAAWENPPYDEVAARNAYEFLRGVVGAWESTNIRAATLLVLEAAHLDEVLSGDELAELLEERLGQDVLPATARQWKKRGLDRLRDEIAASGLLDNTETS